ncbi:MAG: hypothetical protein HQL63_02825 [Magnetococcales bacterium]|nr:hypothetical protein [Magnetococcales bacterium]
MDFSHGDHDLALQGLHGCFDVIDAGDVVQGEELIDLVNGPVEASSWQPTRKKIPWHEVGQHKMDEVFQPGWCFTGCKHEHQAKDHDRDRDPC